MYRNTLIAAVVAAAGMFASLTAAVAEPPAATAAECAERRDTRRQQVIDFNKGFAMSRKLIDQQAKAAGKEVKSGDRGDESWRDPEKMAAATYRDCIAAIGSRPPPQQGAATAKPAAPPKPSTLRVATPAEIAECRAEAGKLATVITLDTTTKQAGQRQPSQADRDKFGGQIFVMCLQNKGARAAPDDMTAQPAPIVVREGPEKKCDDSRSCSVARNGCLRFCATKPGSTACPRDCSTAFSRCMNTGRWSTRNCEKTGMLRQ